MLQYPLVPGHELAGVVTKVGSNVKDVKVNKWTRDLTTLVLIYCNDDADENYHVEDDHDNVNDDVYDGDVYGDVNDDVYGDDENSILGRRQCGSWCAVW